MTTHTNGYTTIIATALLSIIFAPSAVFAESDQGFPVIPLFGFPGGLNELLADDSVAPAYVQLSGAHKEKIASLDAPKAGVKKFVPRQVISLGRIHQVVATAYSSTVDQTDASPCTTANGFNVCKNNIENVIAANYLRFGTRVRLPELYGDRIFIVQDRMNARYGEGRIDLWMKTRESARQFGVKRTTMEIVTDEIAAAL